MARTLRSARILALVAGSFATALVACSLLNGLDADYKLASTSPEEGGRDGDVDPDGPQGDARSDTNVPGDGGPDGDGSTVTLFCDSTDAGPNGFCWDFEKPAGPANWGWSDSLAVKGAYSVVDGVGVNGSKALRASVTNPGAVSGQAYLRQVVSGSTKFTDYRHHELSFWYAIKKGTPLYTASLGALGFGGSGGQYIGASIYAAGATPGLIDISDPPGAAAGTSIPVVIDKWQKVLITLDRPADAGSYTTKVFIDGTAVEETPPPFNPGTSTNPTQIWVGTFFTAMGDGGVEAVIDNVLVRQSN